MPDDQLREKTMTIRTRQNPGTGSLCVNRNPPQISESRSAVDVIRLRNGNPLDSGRSITVTVDPTAVAAMFDPAPPTITVLEAGHSVEWQIKAAISGSVAVRFKTSPDACSGGDQDDFIVRC